MACERLHHGRLTLARAIHPRRFGDDQGTRAGKEALAGTAARRVGLRLTPDRPRPAVAGAAGTVLAAVHRVDVDRLGAERPPAACTDADDAAALAVAEDHERTIPSMTQLKQPFRRR